MNATVPTSRKSKQHSADFEQRHIGISEADQKQMLADLDVQNIEKLIEQTIPNNIRLSHTPDIGVGVTENEALAELKTMANKNQVFTSLIGQGYYNTHIPNVIARNVLENPGWYTAYTPYQPEIAQGRLEALLNFQQMTMDLTGMDIANASLLDEATAAAEAMTLCKRSNRKNRSDVFFVADDVHPQTLSVLKTRAEALSIELTIKPATDIANTDCFGALFQYPNTNGDVCDIASLIETAQSQNTMTAIATDLMALVMLEAPGHFGADIVFGSAQRFGVPMGFGGPHAAFFAARESHKRQIPGRVIGVSIDSNGEPALRMAMQTREQHIRREKATSNICTSQALLANLASFYAVYHGPDGLKKIAQRIHNLTQFFAAGLAKVNIRTNGTFFDTLRFEAPEHFIQACVDSKINVRCFDQIENKETGTDRVGTSFDETTTVEQVCELLRLIGASEDDISSAEQIISVGMPSIPEKYLRTTEILTHPVFHQHRSETQMLRYLKALENKDFSLVHGMIPLGSCTMKLNATAEMLPVSWPEFANMHPFAPTNQTAGYLEMFADLEKHLATLTGYDNVSLQPNSGAQGEYAGLLAIQRYHRSRGDDQRNICLIPSSAHGTNPASASLLNMKVLVVKCDDKGNIDLADLAAKIESAGDQLSACMITYPSTHGVFETAISEICDMIHAQGGQVYLDGANLNAQVGFTNPGFIGADVSHLNLHKTFAIPHGGGGPGMGPIGVKKHLTPYLPGNPNSVEVGSVSAAPYGSAGILAITWMYLKTLGSEGVKNSTAAAILNANYLTHHLSKDYPVLYTGEQGRVAHECIIDIRPIKTATGVTEEDIAKRLMDYGFHAPTMSFPVPGTLMIEPTESEDKAELDRFITAMQTIRLEISDIENDQISVEQSPLRHAPHTQSDLVNNWDRQYDRKQAVFPVASLAKNKFWPTVNRIDNVHGDRNLICSCPPLSVYEDA